MGTTSPRASCTQATPFCIGRWLPAVFTPRAASRSDLSVSAPAPIHLRLLQSHAPLPEEVVYLLPSQLLFHWRPGWGHPGCLSLHGCHWPFDLLVAGGFHPPSAPASHIYSHTLCHFKPQTHCLPGHQLRYTSPFALQPQYPSPIWGSPDSGTTLDLNSDIEPTGKLQQSPRELPGVLLWSPRSTLPLLTALLHPLLSSFPHTLPPSCQLQIYPDLIEKIFNFSFNNY